MNNLSKMLIAFGFGVAFSSSIVSAATFEVSGTACSTSDVSAYSVNGSGPSDSSACLNLVEVGSPVPNDGGGAELSAELNDLFGLDSTILWQQTAKDEAIGSEEISAGSWDFSQYAPLSDPFVILLKSGKGSTLGAYLFNMSGNGKGEFTTAGISSTLKDISHISLYTSISAVPLPATVFLLAPALLGFLGLRRKEKNTMV